MNAEGFVYHIRLPIDMLVECIQERLPGVVVLPVHLWLPDAPLGRVWRCAWWVLALSAQKAMVKFGGGVSVAAQSK